MNERKIICHMIILLLIQQKCRGAFNLTEDFYKLCPQSKTCSTNQTLESSKNKNVPCCCSSCSCKPRCRISRDCCPDAPILGSTATIDDDEIHLKCLPLENMLSKSLNETIRLDDLYLAVHQCPTKYSNAVHINGCNAQVSSRLVDYIPVADWKTGKLFKNYHCAFCHNVTDPVPWKMDSTCIDLYQMNQLPDTIEKLQQVVNSCSVRFKPPVYLPQKPQRCRTDSYSTIISSCNQTGNWVKYDKYIAELCGLDTYIAYFIISRQSTTGRPIDKSEMTIYKNPFCFLCNSNESAQRNLPCRSTKKTELLPNTIDKKRKPSFQSTFDMDFLMYTETMKEVLSVRTPNGQDQTTGSRKYCGFGKYMDPYKHICHEMRCPVNEYGIDGLCFPKNARVNRLALTVNLYVHLLEVPTDYSSLSYSQSFMESLNYTISRKLFGNCDIINSIAHEFSNRSVNEVFVSLTVATKGVCTVHYLLKIFQSIDPDKGKPYEVNQRGFTYEVSITYKDFSKDSGTSFALVVGSVAQSIRLGRFFYCSRIILSTEEYQNAVESGILEKHGNNGLGEISGDVSETVEICISDYLTKYFLDQDKKDAVAVGITTLTILSAVCTVLSMVCTILTLITFAFFKELRLMPGKLFIMLCANILIAQVFFEFGIGVGGSGVDCVALGIAIHYFWLVVAFSMNSCILLMFNHIHYPLKISSRSTISTQRDANGEMCKYVVYTYTCPFIFVLVNIIASLIVTKNKSVGYGGELCYINTSLMRGLSFALPLGLIILVNFVLFGTVLYDIMKLKVQSFKEESENICGQVVIFLKFSTITGIYWTFGFLYEITGLSFLGYAFVLLNAGQGFFLMASFLFNRRVVSLYKGMCLSYMNKMRTSIRTESWTRDDLEMHMTGSEK